MDKKNNDGKTFGDIFSKVNDIKEDNIFNSFNNVSEEDNRTFNSIFDSSTDVKDNFSNEDKSFSDIFNKLDDKIYFNDKKDVINGDSESFSDIFNKRSDDVDNENVDSVDTNNDFDSKIFDNNLSNVDEINISNNNNIFFDNKMEDIGGNSINDSESEEKKSNVNIFFQGEQEDDYIKEEDEINNDDIKEDEINNELQKDVSPFFEKDEEKSNNNPFFDNNISLIESKKVSNNSLDGKIDVSKVQNFDVKIRKKKPNLIQTIIGILSYALFIWLLLIGVALLVYVLDIKIRAAKGDNSPPKYGAYVVLTGSMLPEIQVYDVVVTKKIDAKDLNEGDVITFASSDTRFAGTIITHRIIKKNYSAKTKSYTFQTKGDYNNVADSALVIPDNIFGKVIFKIPKLGYLRDFLASDGGWILVILFPCLAVVSYDIVKITKGLKRKKYNKLKVQSR